MHLPGVVVRAGWLDSALLAAAPCGHTRLLAAAGVHAGPGGRAVPAGTTACITPALTNILREGTSAHPAIVLLYMYSIDPYCKGTFHTVYKVYCIQGIGLAPFFVCDIRLTPVFRGHFEHPIKLYAWAPPPPEYYFRAPQFFFKNNTFLAHFTLKTSRKSISDFVLNVTDDTTTFKARLFLI